MPSKSKRKKGKFSTKRTRQVPVAARSSAATSRQPAVPRQPVAARESAPRSKASAPPVSASMALPISYSTISRELKTIGILGGVLLVVLTVIAVVLS